MYTLRLEMSEKALWYIARDYQSNVIYSVTKQFLGISYNWDANNLLLLYYLPQIPSLYSFMYFINLDSDCH